MIDRGDSSASDENVDVTTEYAQRLSWTEKGRFFVLLMTVILTCFWDNNSCRLFFLPHLVQGSRIFSHLDFSFNTKSRSDRPGNRFICIEVSQFILLHYLFRLSCLVHPTDFLDEHSKIFITAHYQLEYFLFGQIEDSSIGF